MKILTILFKHVQIKANHLYDGDLAEFEPEFSNFEKNSRRSYAWRLAEYHIPQLSRPQTNHFVHKKGSDAHISAFAQLIVSLDISAKNI